MRPHLSCALASGCAVRTSKHRRRVSDARPAASVPVMRSALEVYGRALAAGSGLGMLGPSGALSAVPVDCWTSEEVPGDAGLLGRCRGPVLDVGCGPGRLAAALLARGVPALGVDIAPTAVEMARARGAAALIRSVYERLPGEGRWSTVLLADGNVGIGGDPHRLLSRIRELLAPTGALLVEVGRPGSPTGAVRLRLQDDLGTSEEFPWSCLAVEDVASVAIGAGLEPRELWEEAGRWFAAVRRP
jgi:SAM-dependent methyltransferase